MVGGADCCGDARYTSEVSPTTKMEWFGKVQKRGLEMYMAVPTNAEPDAGIFLAVSTWRISR